MVVVIVVVAGIHALQAVASFYHVFQRQNPNRNPEARTQKQNPEHIMTLVIQFPDNATKIDEGYLAHEPWYFRP
jgi:hypothetical protein